MNDLPMLLPELEPGIGLLPRVLARVERAARRRAKVMLGTFIAMAAGAAGILAVVISYVHQELYASGFYDYVSLFVTDSVARAHWQELVASLVAALPSAAILVVIASGVALGWAALRAVRALQSSHAGTFA